MHSLQRIKAQQNHDYILWNILFLLHTGVLNLLCFVRNTVLLPISFRITSLTLGQSYNFPLTSTIWVNETTKNVLFTHHKTNYKKPLFKFFEPYCIHILLSLRMEVLIFTGNSPTQIWFPLSICINKHQRTCLLIPKCYRRLPGCLTLTLGLGSIRNICITVRKHELILIMMWLIHCGCHFGNVI